MESTTQVENGILPETLATQTDKKLGLSEPLSLLIIGMAGSGKTTFLGVQ